jgi:type VI protein secretion system component Hcp
MATGKIVATRAAALILSLLGSGILANSAMAQTKMPPGVDPGTSRFGGYMRMVSASGHVIAGESTDPNYLAWIPLRQTTMPSAAQMSEMASEDPATAAKTVHAPIVVVKDRDNSSLALLAAFSGKQRFPEVDITLTTNSDKPAFTYKLTDAVIVSVRAGGDEGGMATPVEQLRITYSKIEVK